MEDYSEFRAHKINLYGNKHFKVTNSYGTKQAWRWLKKNKWLDLGQSITEREFGLIIKAMNKLLVDRLLEGHDIVLPCKMGKIELRKFKAKVEYKDGKVTTNLPVNWKRTLQLWYEDPEAHANKLVVRQETKKIFRIIYNKHSANYNNKSFYQFTANRGTKKALSEKILDNKIDAFLIGEHELY